MKLLEIRVFSKQGAPETVNNVIVMLREYRRKTGIYTKVRIKVDDTGYGGGITDYLALKVEDNIEVVPILFGGKGDEEYADYASKMWFNMAAVIKECELPNDELLKAELSTREWATVGGKIKVEPKAEYKDREGDSPDRADACIMCFAEGYRKVFNRDSYDGECVQSFDVDWMENRLYDSTYYGPILLEAKHYVAVVLSPDLMLFAMAAIYEVYTDKLWIYYELMHPEPQPEDFAKKLKYYTQYSRLDGTKKPKIIGNQLLFKPKSSELAYMGGGMGNRKTMAEIFRRECGITVMEPNNYDPYGAIGLGTLMFKNNKIIIKEGLRETQLNINLWQIKNDKVEDRGYWICQCFLLILSEVRQQKKSLPKIQKRGDYSPGKNVLEKATKTLNTWMGR
jgi:hypothetical protein